MFCARQKCVVAFREIRHNKAARSPAGLFENLRTRDARKAIMRSSRMRRSDEDSRSRSRSRERERKRHHSNPQSPSHRQNRRGNHRSSRSRSRERKTTTTKNNNNNSGGGGVSENDEDEDDERRGRGREKDEDEDNKNRKKKKERKRRAFSSKSPTRNENENEKEKREDEDEKDSTKKTTDGVGIQYGYQPRAPNPNGKQSVPKHPQSMVAAKHVSIDGNNGGSGTGGGGGGGTSITTTKATQNSGTTNGVPTTTTRIEEIAAYQKKKQRDARRWLLSQQISAYENLSVPNSDTAKKQRQVYVGNIPPEVDAETLNVFLSSTLSAAYPEALASGKYPNDSLIEEIKMSVDRKYCFATVVDPDMATALFAINGVDLCGYTLMIARPSGWVDPETMKEKADIAYEQMKIIQAEERAELGENLPAHLAAANNVAAASARKVEGGVVAVAEKGVEESVTTVYVQLKHIATEEDVNDDEEYEDLKLDVAAECEKFCSHSSSSSSSLALPRRGPFVGSAFAKFSDKESALNAKEGMHGRAFDGRIIEGSFASESEYEQALKDE